MDRDRQRQGPCVKEWEKIGLNFLLLKSFEHPLVDNWAHHCCTMGLSQLNRQVKNRYVDRIPDVEKQLENPLVDILNCTNLCCESSISVVIGRSRLRRSQFHKTSWTWRTYHRTWYALYRYFGTHCQNLIVQHSEMTEETAKILREYHLDDIHKKRETPLILDLQGIK